LYTNVVRKKLNNMKKNKEEDSTFYGTGLEITQPVAGRAITRFESLVHSVEQWAHDKRISRDC
jgi:hypothetical protein